MGFLSKKSDIHDQLSRVETSFKELETKLSNLEQQKAHLQDTLDKFIKPFVLAQIPTNLIQQIADGQFVSEVSLCETNDPLCVELVQTVRIRRLTK